MEVLLLLLNYIHQIWHPMNLMALHCTVKSSYRGGSRIWLRRGPEFFWPIFANSVQHSCANEVSPHWPGSRAHLRALEVCSSYSSFEHGLLLLCFVGCCLFSCSCCSINALGNIVRAYPEIIQGLTFYRSKNITKNTCLCYKYKVFIVKSQM